MALTFEEVRYQAGCAWRIKQLADVLAIEHPGDMAGPFGDFDSADCAKLARTLSGIKVVLELLWHTPNAYVNREALDAMEWEIKRAKEILAEEWVEDLLEQAEQILKLDQEPDFVPF